MATFWQDVKYGARLLRQAPGFAVVAVLTLALGIGANTAIFSVVRGVVLAPLPYAQPQRLVGLFQRNLTQNYDADISYPDFLDWRRNSRSFSQMAVIAPHPCDLSAPGTPEHLEGEEVSAGFFAMLGVPLAMGREFSPSEDVAGGLPAVIISDGMWTSRFARRPGILGQSVTLDGVVSTIIGVLPPGFQFDTPADVYLPAGRGDALVRNDRSVHAFAAIARLKPRVSLAQASAEMNSVQRQLDELYPAVDRGLAATVVPLKQVLVGDVSATLFLLLGAVGVVLLIACANVGGLLLARSAARSREFALRVALGARPGRMVRQLLTESVLLSLLGGVAGLLAARWGLRAGLAAVRASLPRGANITVDSSVLLFALAAAVLAGILFGVAPALKAARATPQAALQEGAYGVARTRRPLQSILAASQIALTLVLVAGAGLLFRTIRQLWSVNPGLDARHVVTFQIGLPPNVLHSPPSIRNAFQQLLARIQALPGVEAADFTSVLPLAPQDNTGPFWLGPEPPASLAEASRALYFEVGPDYLRTMGIPLLHGRFFTAQDTAESEPVVVIDEALARAYLPGQDPIGQRLTVAHWATARIVGVAGHVKHWGLGNSSRLSQSQIYISFFQLSDQWVPLFGSSMTFAVRTRLDASAVMPAIRSAVYGANHDQPVYHVQTMQQIVADSMSPQRLPLILLAAFAGLALLVASVGVYGLISYSVAQRVREIAIRMALGAGRRSVFWMVIARGLALTLTGLATGLLAAVILARLLTSFSRLLYGVSTNDPATLAAVSLFLLGVALLACYLPARRAMRVDPIAALRHE